MSGKDRSSSVIITVRKRPRLTIYIRAYPKTGESPTPAQRACRIAFGEAAKRAKGIKYAGRGEGLPPAAEIVATAMSGVTFEPHRIRLPQWIDRIAEKLGLTEEEKKMLKERVLESLGLR
jgi:hypothetical protein